MTRFCFSEIFKSRQFPILPVGLCRSFVVGVTLWGSKTHLVVLNLSRNPSFVVLVLTYFCTTSTTPTPLSSDPWDVPHQLMTRIKGLGLSRTPYPLTFLTPWRVGVVLGNPRTDVPRGVDGSYKLECPLRQVSHLSPLRSRSRLGPRNTCHVDVDSYQYPWVRGPDGYREVLRNWGRLVTRSLLVSVGEVTWPRVDKTSRRTGGGGGSRGYTGGTF